jgi:hypothetical protein
MTAILKFNKLTESYDARLEETIHFQNGSLPVIDCTFNGKPTVKYGLTLEEGIEYLNSFNTGLEIVIK